MTEELKKAVNQGEPVARSPQKVVLFFFQDAAWLNERSLSGRLPFCQLKLSDESLFHWKCFSKEEQHQG